MPSFTSAYLTPRLTRIWFLRREGKSQSEIGRSLGVQRQGINEALHIIDSKLSQALREAAHSNKLEVHRVDTVNGILEAHSHAYDVPVVVSFTKSNGVQVWYLYEGRCESCTRRQSCLNLLKAEAEERTIQLKEDDLRLPPTQLGKKIFSTITKTAQKGEANGR
jgi:hypothetical protein